MNTIKLTLEYEGTRYAGWQRQPQQPTVQAAVEEALLRLTQCPLTVVAAGRTDAGVHAHGQVISFRSDRRWPGDIWVRALNALLPGDISVLHGAVVDGTFHARYSATSKLYEYRILARLHRSALHRGRAWHVRRPLDLDAIRQAARHLIGRHDFTSFQSLPTDVTQATCEMKRLELNDDSPWLIISVEADRFLRQMVRVIVGTLVEVGHGKRRAEAMATTLAAKDRGAAGITAPAHGLYLMRGDYANDAGPADPAPR